MPPNRCLVKGTPLLCSCSAITSPPNCSGKLSPPKLGGGLESKAVTKGGGDRECGRRVLTCSPRLPEARIQLAPEHRSVKECEWNRGESPPGGRDAVSIRRCTRKYLTVVARS